MTSAEDWAAWWRDYRRYILHHALLARYAGAEMFSRRRRAPAHRRAAGVGGADRGRAPDLPRAGDLRRQLGRRCRPGGVLGPARRGRRGRLLPAGRGGHRASTTRAWRRGPGGWSGTARGSGPAGRQAGDPDRGRVRRPPRHLERAPRGGRRDVGRRPGARLPGAARRARGPGRRPDQGWLRGVYVWKAFSGDVSARGRRAGFPLLGPSGGGGGRVVLRTAGGVGERPGRRRGGGPRRGAPVSPRAAERPPPGGSLSALMCSIGDEPGCARSDRVTGETLASTLRDGLDDRSRSPVGRRRRRRARRRGGAPAALRGRRARRPAQGPERLRHPGRPRERGRRWSA